MIVNSFNMAILLSYFTRFKRLFICVQNYDGKRKRLDTVRGEMYGFETTTYQ